MYENPGRSSAMRDMSRAIRHELSDHGPTLRDVPTEVLTEYVTILRAFALDFEAELDRRVGCTCNLPGLTGQDVHLPNCPAR